MPAQWQRYSLSTQAEMMAGRMAIGSANYRKIRLGNWAYEGEQWLREHIPAKDLEFHTSWDVDKLEITLTVFRQMETIFTVTEPANAFVSHLTVTKILMIS